MKNLVWPKQCLGLRLHEGKQGAFRGKYGVGLEESMARCW